jgi:hypothetical protein
MELDREPVRLVPHPLEKPQRLRVLGDRERCRATGHEDLLDPFREPDHRDAALRERAQRPHARRELALAAVDDDQIGQRREALVALRVVRREVRLLEEASGAAAEHLFNRCEIVRTGITARRLLRFASGGGGVPGTTITPDLEPAVVGLLRRSALEDDHRGDGVVGPEVRDVEALDPDRERLELQRVLQRGQGVHALLTAALGAQLVLGEGKARVALGKLPKLPLVTALGDADLHRSAATGRQRVGKEIDAIGERRADDDEPRHRRHR